MLSIRGYLALCLLPLLLANCQPVGQQAAAVHQAQDAGSRVTVGTVQREIRIGMSGSEVVEALGSPNMVTTDDLRRETWVWDKISTDTIHSSSSGGVTVLLLGVGGGSGVASTSQRTLTVIVKFDQSSRVRDFSYRSSSF
jgi:outer membrane protein assembly factor BamE (lipoprotein component of BamABCDE complex)